MNFLLCSFTIWQREIVRFMRQRSRIIGTLGQPFLFWILLGSGFGSSFRINGIELSSGYLEYFFPGILVMMILFTAIFSTFSVVEDRKAGFLQSVLVAPVPREAIILGHILGGTTLSIMQGFLFLCAAPLVGITLTTEVIGFSFLTMLVISFSLTSLGLVFAWKIESTQGFHSIMNLFLIPLWLLSGAVFPQGSAHPIIGWLMKINPLTYGVTILRRSLFPGQDEIFSEFPSTLTCWVIICSFTLIIFLIASQTAKKYEG